MSASHRDHVAAVQAAGAARQGAGLPPDRPTHEARHPVLREAQVRLRDDDDDDDDDDDNVMIRFEYQLSHSLEGFYLSTYTDQAGKER